MRTGTRYRVVELRPGGKERFPRPSGSRLAFTLCGGRRRGVPLPSSDRPGAVRGKPRRCVVRLTYRHPGGKAERQAANAAYLRYIGRPGATTSCSPSWEDAVPGRQFYTITQGGRKVMMNADEAASRIGADEAFRVILSPQDPAVDLDELVRQFMFSSFYGVHGMGERSRGFVACNHYNTAHPHAHILISRRPLEPGRNDALRVPPSYVRGEAHREAGLLCTLVAGPRGRREELEEERRMVERTGPSTFDYRARSVQRTVHDAEGRVGWHIVGKDELEALPKAQRKAVARRLNHLCSSDPDAVRKGEDGTFILDADWLGRLRTRGWLGMAGLAGEGKDVHVDNGPGRPAFQPYSGVVRDVTIADDVDEMVLLTIEGDDGRTHLLDYGVRLDDADSLMDSRIKVAKRGRKATIVSREL